MTSGEYDQLVARLEPEHYAIIQAFRRIAMGFAAERGAAPSSGATWPR